MSAICFFPGPQLRPQQLPEDGAVCGASLPLEFGVTKGAVLLNVGKEVTLLRLDFFFLKICPLQRQVEVVVLVIAVALCPLTTSLLLC